MVWRYRRLLMLLFVVGFCFTQLPAPPSAAANSNSNSNSVKVMLDGKLQPFEQSPIVLSGTTYVPFRGIFEALGASVKWSSKEQKVTGVKDGRVVELVVGTKEIVVDGVRKPLSAAPIMRNSRVFVPLRVVAEAFTAKVEWRQATQTVVIVTSSLPQSPPVTEADSLTSDELELANLVNQYRTELGLPAFKVSRSLTQVARAHVADSNQHYDFTKHSECNLHSWSANGDWTPVCYTRDHKQAEKMWNKPREITKGIYTGSGFEISAFSSPTLTPKQALDMWKSSPGHNDVIIGKGAWSALIVMGVAIEGDYSHIWFGMEEDAAGYYE